VQTASAFCSVHDAGRDWSRPSNRHEPPMPPLLVRLTYPLAPADEQRAIDRVATWVALMRHTLTKEYRHEWLETALRRRLRGGLSIRIKAVEAADKGDEIAEAAPPEVGAELQMDLVQKRDLDPVHLQVIAYLQRAAQRPPHKRKGGTLCLVRRSGPQLRDLHPRPTRQRRIFDAADAQP